MVLVTMNLALISGLIACVRNRQGNLMFCDSCTDYRFPGSKRKLYSNPIWLPPDLLSSGRPTTVLN